MLTTAPTEEMIAQWKRLHSENRRAMRPNRKSGAELDAYFRGAYACRPCASKKLERVVTETILQNKIYKEKLPQGEQPQVKTYAVEGAYVAIDIASGFFHVESENTALMERIYDDLFVFRGLDEQDLDNYFLVAQYLQLAAR